MARMGWNGYDCELFRDVSIEVLVTLCRFISSLLDALRVRLVVYQINKQTTAETSTEEQPLQRQGSHHSTLLAASGRLLTAPFTGHPRIPKLCLEMVRKNIFKKKHGRDMMECSAQPSQPCLVKCRPNHCSVQPVVCCDHTWPVIVADLTHRHVDHRR